MQCSGGPRGSIGAMPPGPDQPPKIVLKMTILDTFLKKYLRLHILHNYHKNVYSMWGPCCKAMYALRQVFPVKRTVVSTKISV